MRHLVVRLPISPHSTLSKALPKLLGLFLHQLIDGIAWAENEGTGLCVRKGRKEEQCAEAEE